MQIEEGYYFFRAVAIDKESGDTVVRQSGCYWCPDAEMLKEHRNEYVKYLIMEGLREVRITHTNRESKRNYWDSWEAI